MDDLTRLCLPSTTTTNNVRSLKIDCGRLDDLSFDHVLQNSLHDLYLYDCQNFSIQLFLEIGRRCRDLRCLYLNEIKVFDMSALKELLSGCSKLESLSLCFVSRLPHSITIRNNELEQVREIIQSRGIEDEESLRKLQLNETNEFDQVLSWAPKQLRNLLIECKLNTEVLQPNMLPNLQKLCLTVSRISDTLVNTITTSLLQLMHLDLKDISEEIDDVENDLSNLGLQRINENGRLKYISLLRVGCNYFKNVNDKGVIQMGDKWSSLETVSLGGFRCVTHEGFKFIFSKCRGLKKLRIWKGRTLIDDEQVPSDAPTTLTNICLRYFSNLKDSVFGYLATNKNLRVLNLRHCKNLRDSGMKALSNLHKLEILSLDHTNISDTGIYLLGSVVRSSLTTLSVRGCTRLTDSCLISIVGGSSGRALRNLDLSGLPKLSILGIKFLAENAVSLIELRLRSCVGIGDDSIQALAETQFDEGGGWVGRRLKLLDVSYCNLTESWFQWFTVAYFPQLRWLGIYHHNNYSGHGYLERGLIDLKNKRPLLQIACRHPHSLEAGSEIDSQELGISKWDSTDGDGMQWHDREEIGEEQDSYCDGTDDNDGDVMELHDRKEFKDFYVEFLDDPSMLYLD
ncbi:Leucine-rich repeat [Macleaya cordata]|uniref:Leucine-rich repeat n=1 Tax=Macleaya cordata TaxID=56857 RepID=A0A200PQX0_MACCD|nr:Leucine-rich repeat [Macleaya cordata]